MKEETTKISYPIASKILLKFFGLVSMALGLFMINIAWQLAHLQVVPLVFGLLFFVLGIFSFAEGFTTTIIDAQGIVQKSLVQKTKIPKKQIKGYREVTYKSSK